MLSFQYKNIFDNLADFSSIKQFIPYFKLKNSTLIPSKTEVMRSLFLKNLIKNNLLQVRVANGDFLTIPALSYDRINSLLVVSEKAEPGLLLLEKGDKVEIFSALDDSHEYFSFIATVEKVRPKGIVLNYYLSVPKLLKKSRRRVTNRKRINNHSIVRIDGSQFAGHLIDMSYKGLGVAIQGYYPGELEVGKLLPNCTVDIFLPRINDNISFSCAIKVMRYDYVSSPERATFIGGTYKNHDGEKNDLIMRYLSSTTGKLAGA